MLKDEIKAKLTEAEVPFDEDMKKEELLRLLEKTNQSEVKEDTAPAEEQDQDEEPQKKYVVVHDFKDLKDIGRVYIKGDPFPYSEDTKVSEARIKELSSTKNKIGRVLIKEQA